MRTTRIANADPVPLGAPADWDPEQNGHCGGLFIRRETIDGIPFMRSAWEADQSEASLLLAGAKMIIGVSGVCHPVLHTMISELPDLFEPVVTARRINAADGTALAEVDMLFSHGGGRRGKMVVRLNGSFAGAVAHGITEIEALARREGWIE